MLTSLTDEELAYKSKQGDQQAFEILARRYKSFLQKITRGYFLVGSEQDDLLQEATIALYKAIQSYDQSQNTTFRTFASLVVKRHILSSIKQSNTQKNKILNESLSLSSLDKSMEEEDSFLFLPNDVLNLDEQLIQDEKFEEIKQKIAQALSKLESQILSEYLKGHSYQTIAENLAINTKSVDNALSRIKQKLQFLLK